MPRSTESRQLTGHISMGEEIREVMGSGDARLARLAAAGTSVTFVVESDAPDSVTLLLDRHPPVVVDGQEPAEVTIFLTRAQAAKLAVGRLSLPTEMAEGNVPFRGPARKYLAVHPVLRSLLEDLAAGRLHP